MTTAPLILDDNALAKRMYSANMSGRGIQDFAWEDETELTQVGWEMQAKEVHDAFVAPLAAEITRLRTENAAMRSALEAIVNAKALACVRGIVAGWNGEGKPDGPYQRHPDKLGATIPKTTCGAIYALDEAMTRARAALSTITEKG